MKILFTLNILIILSLSACLVKEPEPRKPTVFGNANNSVTDNLPYTQPNCQLTNNKMNGNYTNLNITFSSVTKTIKSATVTMIEATNANNDEITILINNFKDLSADYNIVQSINVSKNQAYIEMNVNSLSQSFKYFLFSNVGTLHVLYDNSNKNWTLSFCQCKMLDNPSGGNQYIINGKFLVD